MRVDIRKVFELLGQILLFFFAILIQYIIICPHAKPVHLTVLCGNKIFLQPSVERSVHGCKGLLVLGDNILFCGHTLGQPELDGKIAVKCTDRCYIYIAKQFLRME